MRFVCSEILDRDIGLLSPIHSSLCVVLAKIPDVFSFLLFRKHIIVALHLYDVINPFLFLFNLAILQILLSFAHTIPERKVVLGNVHELFVSQLRLE